MPKGVYERNKQKESADKKNAVIDEVKEAVATKPVGHPVHTIEAWNPVPDMRDIHSVIPEEQPCGGCKHRKNLHYGSERNWCNLAGCQCQAWQE